MSIYVETILRNKYEIRATLQEGDDEYDDLLIIEKTIADLKLKSWEIEILDSVSSTGSYKRAAEDLKKSRATIVKHYRRICQQVAEKIGSYFLNSNYAEHLKEKYNLSTIEFNNMCSYLGNPEFLAQKQGEI